MRGSQFFKRILRDNRGATAVEYGLILGLLFLAIVVTVQAVAGEVIESWNHVESTSTDAKDATVPADS
ncbi:MAG TPA: Flp family type IVb pilin [Croceibacterium sp.]